MAGLLYKDLILNRKNLALIGGAMLLISSILFMSAPEGMETVWSLLGLMVYAALFAISGEMLQSVVFEPDESRKWAYFISSTPMLAKGQVLSKYIFVLLISSAVFVWCAVCNALSTALHEGSDSMIKLITVLFFVQVILRAAEIPFIVRFGRKIGGLYKGILSVLALTAIMVYLLFGDISHIGSPEKFFDWFLETINDKERMRRVITVLSLTAAASYCLSYLIARKLYLKGTEYYDG